jgi:hypothetical protein
MLCIRLPSLAITRLVSCGGKLKKNFVRPRFAQSLAAEPTTAPTLAASFLIILVPSSTLGSFGYLNNATTMNDPVDTTSTNIDGLDARLQRLEFLLAGTCEDLATELNNAVEAGGEVSIRPRIAALQRDLAKLQKKSHTVAEILSIRTHLPPPLCHNGDGAHS